MFLNNKSKRQKANVCSRNQSMEISWPPLELQSAIDFVFSPRMCSDMLDSPSQGNYVMAS